MGSRATVIARVAPLQPHSLPDRRSWVSFLEDQLPANWLPGEWDPRTGILTPLPDTGRFSVVTCSRTGCTTVIENRRKCRSCLRFRMNPQATAAGPARAERGAPAQRDCVLTRDGVRCGRNQVSKGLCRTHYALFKANQKSADVQTWLTSTTSKPEPFIPCAASRCPISADNPNSDLLLCSTHCYRLAAKRRRGEILDQQSALRWLSDPVESPVRLRTGRLDPRVSAEIRYVIQAHLDLARGPLQVRVENSLFYAEAEWATDDPSRMDQLARGILALLVEYRGLPIFCILLGFTTRLMLTRDERGRRQVSTRATGFFVLGALHGVFFFPGDILAIFGLALFVVLWLERRTATTRAVVTWMTACGFVGQAVFASWGITLSTNFDDISVGMTNFPEATLARSVEWLAYLLTFPLHASAVLFPLLIGLTTWTRLTESSVSSQRIISWGAGLVLVSVLLCLPNALFLASHWGEVKSGMATFAAQIGGLSGALGTWILATGYHRVRPTRGSSESWSVPRLLEIMGQRTLSLYLGSSVVFFVALSPNGLNLLSHWPLWIVWAVALLGLNAYARYVRAGRSPVGWAENAHRQFSRSLDRRQQTHDWNQSAGDSNAAWIREIT